MGTCTGVAERATSESGNPCFCRYPRCACRAVESELLSVDWQTRPIHNVSSQSEADGVVPLG